MTRQTTVVLFMGVLLLGALCFSWPLPALKLSTPSGNSPKNSHQITDDDLKRVFGQIHEGMSYSEISLLLSSIDDCRPFQGEHGGTWCSISSVGGFTLSLRFEHSTEGLRPELATKKLADCLLNMPPGLSDPNGIEVLADHKTSSHK